MQLRDFAERVLFSRSLDEKLTPPPELNDAEPGSVIAAPREPGRPKSLEFQQGRSQTGFPRPHELETDEARGRLLHFFANHELLATELMALVLLKFPDAPRAFRKGILRTLKEEQIHTRMYLRRLRQLGVEFGQYPVNGYFWNVICDMPTPMDYVSRLSLTFEQANLDYSRHFARLFKRLGDLQTEKLLDKIYHDEIGHVGYGLKWFRKWKDPGLSDWDAFKNQLHFPLSPSRAKAEPFNLEGRHSAGLDDEFVRQLFVYSKSKGRAPAVTFFNPFAESFMGRGKSFSPNKQQAALARDLETLPQFLCRKDDVVLVNQRPRIEYLAELKEAGFDLPQFEVLSRGRLAKDSELRHRKIGMLRPWAWSPDSIELLQPLVKNLTSQPMPMAGSWDTQIKPLFAKSFGTEVLRELLTKTPDDSWLCPPSLAGIRVTDYESALGTIQRFRAEGHARIVAKLEYGVAGSNMLRLWEPITTEPQNTWLRRNVELEGAVIIEPWLERVLDFSHQYEMTVTGLQSHGFLKMENDARGQFHTSVYTPKFTQGLPQETARFLHAGVPDKLKQLYAEIGSLLEPRLARAGFTGPLGVDAFIYRTTSGELRLKPIVEINARFTMGRLLLELMRTISRGSCGKMEIVSKAMLKHKGFDSLLDYAGHMKRKFPLRTVDHPKRRIVSGAVCLNDPIRATGCLAVLVISAVTRRVT